jgi:hypothetical protein
MSGKLSWALVGVSVFVAALSALPTKEGLTLFAINALATVSARVVAKRGA